MKHKLDGTEYAVKKILIRTESLEHVKNYLSEVKTFASVNHPNVVQYKAAWLDMDVNQSKNMLMNYDDEENERSSEETADHKYHTKHQEYEFNEMRTSFTKKLDEDSSDFEIVFEHSINNIESGCSNGVKKKSKRIKRSSISDGGKALWPLDQREIDNIRFQQKKRENWATLYIQMTLCQLTLKQWMSQRNRGEKSIDPMKAVVPVKIVKDSTVREILKQLLEGRLIYYFFICVREI